ncbi:hypothetical protein [Thalassospira sp. A3_1]|uniref:hypothetical protein n=1 Tax=Thalassospira sp. A3_1 TaxID=2821088 RepID=UPI001AD9C130|nr:hypothetical protein [Thalassospira sp. A3_1]MBO9507484.1 hypothetical protein [Thalassospira sp. A3_1]
MADPRPAIDDRPLGMSEQSIGPLATNPGTPASRSRADPIRAQFGPADSRHCHASPTGLAPD